MAVDGHGVTAEQALLVGVTTVEVADHAVDEVDGGLLGALGGEAGAHDEHEAGAAALGGDDALDAADGPCHVAHLLECRAAQVVTPERLVVGRLVTGLLYHDLGDVAELAALGLEHEVSCRSRNRSGWNHSDYFTTLQRIVKSIDE